MTETDEALVLVSDDDAAFREAVRFILMGEPYRLLEASTLEKTWDLLKRERPDLLLLDVHFKGEGSSLPLLERMKEEKVEVPTLILSGAATAGEAARAIRLGAHDFLEKPVSEERLRLTMIRTLEHARLHAVATAVSENSVAGILGESEAMAAVRKLVLQYAPRDVKVLITGETGVGKEVVASAIWKASRRANKPLVVLNAAAIPESLMESELFGHRKGAFTGATSDQEGKLELAHEGTLFLDEIGELPPQLQNKLLRFLETGEIQKVGSQQTRRVDVRVVAATSRDLDAAMAEGRFRADLYYRLNVGHIAIPPLRERRADVAPLFLNFLAKACEQSGEVIPRIHPEAIDLLRSHAWPGNVRELRNAAERCMALTAGDVDADVVALVLGRERAQESLNQEKSAGKGRSMSVDVGDDWISLKEFRERAEQAYIQAVLAALGGNVTRTAMLLGIDRSYLHQKMAKLGLQREKG